jgi:hypothetical protein
MARAGLAARPRREPPGDHGHLLKPGLIMTERNAAGLRGRIAEIRADLLIPGRGSGAGRSREPPDCGLIRLGHPQAGAIREAPPDDHHADWQVTGEARRNRDGGMTADIERAVLAIISSDRAMRSSREAPAPGMTEATIGSVGRIRTSASARAASYAAVSSTASWEALGGAPHIVARPRRRTPGRW